MKKLLLIFLLLCGGAPGASPHNALIDSVEVSLLTCEPGAAIYEQYGHTAIRVRRVGDTGQQPLDIVFNYGCFDFNEPNFGLRFALGQTDYMLCGIDFKYFEMEYAEQRRRVWQQTLNLDPEERQRLVDALVTNAMPQHRIYRYNFLYNNCTTKCRDIIEASINGAVRWRGDTARTTFRQMMHECNKGYFWDSQSIDFCLGATVDTLITPRDKMFAPMYMKWSLEEAFITRNGATEAETPLMREEKLIISPDTPFTPDTDSTAEEICAVILLALYVVGVLTAFGKGRLNLTRALLSLFWIVLGALGAIIHFLYFLSEHPSVDTNALVFAFSPLTILAAALWRFRRAQTVVLALILALAAVFLCVLPLKAQDVPSLAFYLLIMEIGTVSLAFYKILKRKL